MKMPRYQYRDSQYEEKTVTWLSQWEFITSEVVFLLKRGAASTQTKMKTKQYRWRLQQRHAISMG